MKKLLLTLSFLLLSTSAFAADPITGVWKTIDDETGEPKSLIQIYEYQGKCYGRVIKLFKNVDATAKDIKGNPKIQDLDVIWEMEDTGDKFTNGKILDPKKGKIYNCEIWKDKDEEGILIVRGKIGPFGRSQRWVKDDAKTASKLTPTIPEQE